MNIPSENIEPERLRQDAEALRNELEQARVALEDMDQRVAELAAANARLTEQLQKEVHLRQQAEAQVQSLMRAEPPPEQTDTKQEDALRAQLSNALEELHVMAEELSLAQEELQQGAHPR